MKTEPSQSAATDGAHALIQHLRANPADASRLPGDLSAQFGLDSGFVENVLAQVRPGDRRDKQSRGELGPKQALEAAAARISGWFHRITDRPELFLAITMLLVLLIGVGGIWVLEHPLLGASNSKRYPFIGAIGVLVVLIFGTHLACLFRHARTRYTLYGAAVNFVIPTGLVWTLLLLDKTEQNGISKPALLLLILFAFGMLSGLYAGLGSIFCVLGGWYQMKQSEDQEDQMSRQELLQRYFELQLRLESGIRVSSEQFWENWTLIRLFRRQPWIWAFAISACGSLSHGLAAHLFKVTPGTSSQLPPIGYFICLLAVTAIQFTGYVVLAFLAGTFFRAVMTSLAYSTGSSLAMFVPMVQQAIGSTQSPWASPTYFLISSVSMSVLAGFIGLGATLQQRAAREKSLQKGDQATLLGEMLRVQWRLSNAAGNVCVLVADVVKSTRMKQGADPLVVEYSFREYQKWVSRICHAFSGKVHSTAGDGTVVAFESCEQALSAAQDIQVRLDEFNATLNRLGTPFQVRIGLHVGQVEGDLDAVQFTSVIDVAAHVEETCEPGGVAVTDEVVAQLGAERFRPLSHIVGGYQVFAAAAVV